MPTTNARGRYFVIAICLAIVTIAILGGFAEFSLRGAQRLPMSAFRVAVALVLALFLYQGSGWARIIAVALYAVDGAELLIYAVARPHEDWTDGVLLGAMAVCPLAIALVLKYEPSVRAYFDPDLMFAEDPADGEKR